MSEYEVRVDRKKCIGAGFCEKLVPRMFKLDVKNKATLNGGVAVDDETVALTVGDNDLKDSVMAAKVCPSYAISVANKATGENVLDIEPEKHIEVRNIPAHYDSMKEWVMDPLGFFTIKPFPDEGVIRVRYYNAKHQLAALIEGKSAEEIYITICREGLVSIPSHAAYLGSELQKAEIAMKKRIDYVQDDPLNI
ncbi:ferredoxin [Candidatus Woesearchaeota archaeon]|nr:ferredoxin [Candidatus Woesearchaeota archaeon]